MVIGLVGLVFVSINIKLFDSRSASPGSLYSYYLSQQIGDCWPGTPPNERKI
jgi:hypothetical protein